MTGSSLAAVGLVFRTGSRFTHTLFMHTLVFIESLY